MSDNKDLSPITESTAAPSPSKSSPGNNGVPATEEETRARLFKGLGKDLLIAIRENDMGKAQGLIMGGVELDARDAYGRTALHLAVQRSAMGVVKLLCKHGIDVNLTDRLTENSAIHIAAHRGQMVMMKHLILAKADTNIVGVEGDTPLSRAATQGHLKVIDTLINEGASADLSTRKKPNEYQLLEQQQQSMAHSWGHSGVMMTAAGSMTSEASFVASPGSRRGRSPTRSGFGAQRAGEYNYMGARERRDPVSPLLKAVKRNAGVPVIKTLLEIGCSPEKTDEKNNTALHVAAHYGNANTCRMLLQAKASVNVLNHLGRTPLHFAARAGHPRIFRMLLDYKAEINGEDTFGQTPLTLSCDSMMQKLIKDSGGKQGQSAMGLSTSVGGDHSQMFDRSGSMSPPVSPTRSLSPAVSPTRSPSPGQGKLHGGPVVFQERTVRGR